MRVYNLVSRKPISQRTLNLLGDKVVVSALSQTETTNVNGDLTKEVANLHSIHIPDLKRVR